MFWLLFYNIYNIILKIKHFIEKHVIDENSLAVISSYSL